jgi:hypothetical protein
MFCCAQLVLLQCICTSNLRCQKSLTCPSTSPGTMNNVKLYYTDGTMQKMLKGICLKGYGTAMGGVEHALGVSSKHTTHLSHVLGPKVLEMQEFSPEEICVLGNLDPKVQERSTYLTKLPMKVVQGWLVL